MADPHALAARLSRGRRLRERGMDAITIGRCLGVSAAQVRRDLRDQGVPTSRQSDPQVAKRREKEITLLGDGYTYEEIAGLLRVPVTTVKADIRRYRQAQPGAVPLRRSTVVRPKPPRPTPEAKSPEVPTGPDPVLPDPALWSRWTDLSDAWRELRPGQLTMQAGLESLLQDLRVTTDPDALEDLGQHLAETITNDTTWDEDIRWSLINTIHRALS
ncbi:sigma-70 region 4 domain-containing protein [Dyella psychrodurans]|uniref:Uncharacterized protein n=1 Tax=Dyella psychrodurans TaxID=1927960 RepID=A0A370XCC4_9GAMM|nr:sigma-70 region 4 domain-containing protein [Dyella psychrodurans]RDS85927.1 hypothetical protein DWU99_01215 [Dyella psychrodurans]